jgi:hypothetical protein
MSGQTTALAKVTVSAQEASSVRMYRRVRQIIEQRDQAVARIDASTRERLRLLFLGQDDDAATGATDVAQAAATA